VRTATITRSGAYPGYLEVRFSFRFNRQTVLYHDLMELPEGTRRWSSVTMCWLIDEGVSAQLRRVLDDNNVFTSGSYGWNRRPDQESYREHRREEPRQEARSNPVSAYSKLFITPDAPIEVAQAAYRALAMKLHPDRNGGDGKAMVDVNLAFEQIKKLKGW
jgi:hypothetical protein